MLEWVSPKGDVGAQRHARLLLPSFHWQLLSRRWPYIIFPALVVSIVGIAAAAVLPSTYLAKGKLIVQPQQISTELVRATVTSAAQDRLQLVQQRTMSASTLLAIADKYQLFPEKRRSLTTDEFIDLVRSRAQINVLDLTPEFGIPARATNPPVVFTIGYEYSDPVIAQEVAVELINLFMGEYVRDRKERAANTTKFVADEYQRQMAEAAATDARISELRARLRSSSTAQGKDSEGNLLAQLKEEFAQKSALYSDQHPILKSLARQIRVMQASQDDAKAADNAVTGELDALTAQQEAARKKLEVVAARMNAAQNGENLENAQQAEKLDILEPATVPERPIRPNRLKIVATAIAAGLVIGAFLAYLAETLDTGIRSPRDLFEVVDHHLVSTIPYITTRNELRNRGLVRALIASVLVIAVLGVSLSARAIATHFHGLIGTQSAALRQSVE